MKEILPKVVKKISMSSFGECIICGNPITTRVLLPCNHSNFCLKCYETLVYCYNEAKCPFCQKEIESDPVCTANPHLDGYEIERLKPYQHDQNFHIFFDDPEIICELDSYTRITCPDCHALFNNFSTLRSHVNEKHNKMVCKICFDSNRFLPSDISLYTREEFEIHKKQHPKCSCCDHIAFDQDSLSKHMREAHFRCEICANAGKILWFPTIELIQVHFHEKHYACEDPLCVMQGFIVFSTKIEYLLHQINVHNADPSILNDQIENKPQVEDQSDYPSFRARHTENMNRLLNKLNSEQNVNAKQLLSLIEDVDKHNITADTFCSEIRKLLTNQISDKLFPDIVSVILAPKVRNEVVRSYQGIKEVKKQLDHNEYPTFEETKAPEPPKPVHQRNQTGSKKKPKKIVLMY